MKNILIYGLGSISGIITLLFNKNYNFFITSLFNFEKKIIKNNQKYNVILKWNRNLKQSVSVKKWNKEKIDLIICGVKLNGIFKFYNYLNENNLYNVPIIFIQNGINFEPESVKNLFFLQQKYLKNRYSQNRYIKNIDSKNINKLKAIEYYRFIVLFNGSKNINLNRIYWNTKGKILIPEQFLFKYHPFSHLKLNKKSDLYTDIIIQVKKIKPYIFRKLWLNTTNGFLTAINFSLRKVFYYKKYLIYFIYFLKETNELFRQAEIETEKLPALDPIDLIKAGEKILLFFDKKYIKNFSFLNKIKYFILNLIFNTNKGYVLKKILLNPVYKNLKIFSFIINLPDSPNSTLQSLKNKKESEYKFIVEKLDEIASKKKIPYFLNHKIKNLIYKFEVNKNYKPVKVHFFKDGKI